MKKYNFIAATGILILLLACSQLGRRNATHIDQPNSNTGKFPSHEETEVSRKKTVLKMENEGGVKFVYIEINGLRLKFIFDTGASSVCISSAEAMVLYRQGTLQQEDILDNETFRDATGRISEGTKINLREVKIGDRVLNNVQATVIDNSEAPLLLGQTAFQNFGRISIDNAKGTITFE